MTQTKIKVLIFDKVKGEDKWHDYILSDKQDGWDTLITLGWKFVAMQGQGKSYPIFTRDGLKHFCFKEVVSLKRISGIKKVLSPFAGVAQ